MLNHAYVEFLVHLVLKIKALEVRTLLVAPGLTTRNKDATRNKGHRYLEQGRYNLS